MLPAPPSERARDDRCPGVLRLIDAIDGGLARVRLPGGLIGADALHALADTTRDLGDGRLELTSRGNIQVRGLDGSAGPELRDRLHAAGLLPSATHERVRNLIASPLAGIDNATDLTALVDAFDRLLVGDAVLQSLPGRFLFAIDDGRGDVGASGADVVAVLRGDAAWVEGVVGPAADVPRLLVRAAHAFLAERDAQGSDAWHVGELSDGRRRLRERLADAPDDDPALPRAPQRPIGRVARADGRTALVVATPLGRLTAEQANWVAERAGGESLRVTPWRRIVLPVVRDTDTDSAEVGLVVDEASPWLQVSACAGRPRCTQALADVQRDASAALDRWSGRRVHWSGCNRRCGRTNDVEIDVVATEEGYRIEDAADA